MHEGFDDVALQERVHVAYGDNLLAGVRAKGYDRGALLVQAGLAASRGRVANEAVAVPTTVAHRANARPGLSRSEPGRNRGGVENAPSPAATSPQRRRDEGKSFRQVRNQVKRDAAMRLFDTTTLSVEAVAEGAEFGSASALVRAFRAWTGLTPRAYRTGASALDTG